MEGGTKRKILLVLVIVLIFVIVVHFMAHPITSTAAALDKTPTPDNPTDPTSSPTDGGTSGTTDGGSSSGSPTTAPGSAPGSTPSAPAPAPTKSTPVTKITEAVKPHIEKVKQAIIPKQTEKAPTHTEAKRQIAPAPRKYTTTENKKQVVQHQNVARNRFNQADNRGSGGGPTPLILDD